MKTPIANDKLDSILAKVEKKGAAAPKLIEDLKDLLKSDFNNLFRHNSLLCREPFTARGF